MIDMRTVIFSYIVSNAICVIVVVALWLNNRRRFAGIGFWAVDYVLQFLGLILNAARGTIPDLISMTGSNTLIMGGTLLLFMGLERFVGKRGSQIHNFVLLALFVGVHAWFTVVNPSLRARNIIFSVGLFILCFQCAWLILKRVDFEMRSIARGIGIIFVAYCLVSLIRIVEDLMLPVGQDFFQANIYDTSIVIVYQMLFIALTFALVLVVNRRLVGSLELDLVERSQADAALKLSEEKFFKAFHSSPDAIIITRACDGQVVEVNEGFSRITEYSAEEALSSSSINLHLWANPGDRDVFLADLQKHRIVREVEHDFRAKSGRILRGLVSGELIQLNGEAHVLSIVRDITEQKRVEDDLRIHNNVLATLYQVTLDLINRHDVNDILQSLLTQISRFLDAPDISVDLLEGNDTLVTYAATSGQPLQIGDAMRRGEGGWLSWQAIESGQPAILEDYSKWDKRRELYTDFPIHAIMVIPIRRQERVIGAINISRREENKPFGETDIDAARQLAQMVALVLDNAKLYSQLQTELEEHKHAEAALLKLAAVEERQRLARDLHDSVSQSIHSLVLFSETLISMLQKDNIARARQIAGRLQESARQALKEARLMLYELSSSGMVEREVDLVEDLETRLATVERRAGVRAQIVQEGSLDHCPKTWYENLFWITIEALNNALKHAQARHMQIRLACFPQSVSLEIEDDGIGFDPATARSGGLGLRNMRERAELLGGQLTIDSSPGKGSRISFRSDIKEE